MPRGRVKEVKYLKERQNWSSGGEKCEQKSHRRGWVGREPKDHLVLASLPGAGNLPLD